MKYLITGTMIVGIVIIIVLSFSVPVWLLWNWLMPAIFGVKTISWAQSLGLTMLCWLLFNSPNKLNNK